MDYKCFILVCFLAFVAESSAGSVPTFIREFVQNNLAGPPVVHERTEWDLNPEQGKSRRAQYEKLNGRFGEDLIARLGMGMSFDGPWGVKVSNQPKPDLRYEV